MSTSDKDIRERAMQWADRVHESSALSSSERSEFEQFTSAPHQEREFLVFNRIIATVQDCAPADLDRWTQLANTQPRAHGVLRNPVFRWGALAASILIALVLVSVYAQTQHWFGGQAFVTHTGETRTVTFEEGSVAYLNTRTELRWIGNDRDRRVELTEGEALFDVVHDDTRPFRVVLDNSEIRVLGTRFNVYRKPNGYITVSVLEGTVEVRGFGGGGGGGDSKAEWVRTLHANEELSYRAIGLLSEPHAAQAGSAAAWRSGYYRFRDQPIESVLEELTRYTDQRIVIRDPRIAEFRINGRLSTRDVRDSLRSMQDLAPIEFKENNKTFTLDYKAGADRGKD